MINVWIYIHDKKREERVILKLWVKYRNHNVIVCIMIVGIFERTSISTIPLFMYKRERIEG